MMARRIENEDGMYPKLTIPLAEMTGLDWERLQKITDQMFDLDAILNRMARAIEPMMGDIAEPCTSKLQGDARELAQRNPQAASLSGVGRHCASRRAGGN